MKKLREILLTQYIGAITIGFVLAQTVTGVISGVVQTGFNYYWTRHDSSSVLSGAAPFPWKTLLFWLATALLETLAALVLIRWLYASDEVPDGDSSETSEGPLGR
jgi:hypothetical protein